MEWFQNLWKQRRTQWSTQVQRDQGAVVFLGDSITQGWGVGLGAVFPGVKVANRGISGDTTRGVLIRLKEDVLDLNPRAVVHPDRNQRSGREGDARDDRQRLPPADLDALEAHNPKMPIIVCLVMPSSVTMQRPAEDIKKINALRMASIKGDAQVIPLDTWTLFADKHGRADQGRVPRPAAPEQRRLHQVRGGAAADLRHARLRRDRARLLHARARLREPVQRQGPHGLGPAADDRGRQGEREALAGVRPNAAAWPIVPDAVSFDGKTSSPDGRFRRSTAGWSSPRRPSRAASSRSGRSASSRRTSC